MFKEKKMSAEEKLTSTVVSGNFFVARAPCPLGYQRISIESFFFCAFYLKGCDNICNKMPLIASRPGGIARTAGQDP